MKNKDASTFRKFYHMNFTNEDRDIKTNQAISSLFSRISDSVYYMREEGWDEYIQDIADSILHSCCRILGDLDLSKDATNESIDLDDDLLYSCDSDNTDKNIDIKLHVNISNLREGIHEETFKSDLYFLLNDEIFEGDLVSLAIKVADLLGFNDEKDDEDCDDDYYDYDYFDTYF